MDNKVRNTAFLSDQSTFHNLRGGYVTLVAVEEGWKQNFFFQIYACY